MTGRGRFNQERERIFGERAARMGVQIFLEQRLCTRGVVFFA